MMRAEDCRFCLANKLSGCSLVYVWALFPLSMTSIFFISLGDPLVLTAGLGVMQLMSPMDMRARIMSLFTILTLDCNLSRSLLLDTLLKSLGHKQPL